MAQGSSELSTFFLKSQRDTKTHSTLKGLFDHSGSEGSLVSRGPRQCSQRSHYNVGAEARIYPGRFQF